MVRMSINDDCLGMLMFSGEFKSKIIDALLSSTSKRTWARQFEKFGLVKFVNNSDDAYTDLEFSENLNGSGLSAIYYWNDVNIHLVSTSREQTINRNAFFFLSFTSVNAVLYLTFYIFQLYDNMIRNVFFLILLYVISL